MSKQKTRKRELKINLNKIRIYMGVLIVAALIIMEAVTGAQYVSAGTSDKPLWMYIMLVVSCIVLDILVILQYYLVKNTRIKLIIYGFCLMMLLIISLITASSFLVVIYCLVMTELYFTSDDLKINFAMFVASFCTFTVSFVCGWVRLYAGVSTYNAIVEILGSLIYGVIILFLHFGLLSFIMRFYRNIVRLREAVQAEAESKRELEEAYDKLAEAAVYEERNRIAKDIHDNAGHSITAVIMQTEAAKLLIDTDPEEAKNRVISANIQAKNALEQMRASVHILAGRKTVGPLGDEIADIVAQTIDGTEIKIRTDVEDVPMDSERIRFICNSVKECLANGIRHGGATAFYIEAKRRDDTVRVIVSDNGCGHEGNLEEGFGLGGMREKITSYGGEMTVTTSPDDGFEVSFYIPLPEPPGSDGGHSARDGA